MNSSRSFLHTAGQGFVDQLAIALVVEAPEIDVAGHHRIQEAAEEIGVLSLFKEKRRQIQLLFDPALLAYGQQQRHDIVRHRLFACLEQRSEV